MKKLMKKRPSQARSKETVRIIIESAIKILLEEGARSFNTNHVADVAGVSIGSLYQYFPNKESILTELVQTYFQYQDKELLDYMNSLDLEELTPKELLDALINKHYQIIFSQPPISRTLLNLATELHIDEDLGKFTKETINIMHRQLKKIGGTFAVEKKKLALTFHSIMGMNDYYFRAGHKSVSKKELVQAAQKVAGSLIFEVE